MEKKHIIVKLRITKGISDANQISYKYVDGFIFKEDENLEGEFIPRNISYEKIPLEINHE